MKSFGVKLSNHKIVSKIEFDATINMNIEFCEENFRNKSAPDMKLYAIRNKLIKNKYNTLTPRSNTNKDHTIIFPRKPALPSLPASINKQDNKVLIVFNTKTHTHNPTRRRNQQ